ERLAVRLRGRPAAPARGPLPLPRRPAQPAGVAVLPDVGAARRRRRRAARRHVLERDDGGGAARRHGDHRARALPRARRERPHGRHRRHARAALQGTPGRVPDRGRGGDGGQGPAAVRRGGSRQAGRPGGRVRPPAGWSGAVHPGPGRL
ncbi:MAG: hypothetical protein AVDCRST_MAG06-2655, partial [uncultured Nocardioides sp.]